MKTLFSSFFLVLCLTIAAQESDAYVPVSESAVPVAVRQAIDRDFPGEQAYDFTTFAKAGVLVATIYRKQSVLRATYSNEALLISTAEHLAIEYLPVNVKEQLVESNPGYDLPRTFVLFRTIINDEGVLNYRVELESGNNRRLVIIDGTHRILSEGLAPIAFNK